MTADEQMSGVLERIDADELADLAVELGNVYSPTGHDRLAAEYVYDWLGDHGFEPRKIGIVEERFNVLGRLVGSGGGTSLAFNSHLDNLVSLDDRWVYIDPTADVLTKARRDDEGCVRGLPVMNCKGPMACWMIACKALKEAGADLRGDVLLTHACGEIELEPVDEYQGVTTTATTSEPSSMIAHGAVADYALVSEVTAFQAGLVEAGKAWCKVTVKAGPTTYHALLPARRAEEPEPERDRADGAFRRPLRGLGGGLHAAPHSRVRARDDGPEGRRVGDPRGLPAQALAGARALQRLRRRPPQPRDVAARDPRGTAGTGRRARRHGRGRAVLLPPRRRGHGVEPLYDALAAAHEAERGLPLERQTDPPTISMWRDPTPFNEAEILSLTYGPGANAATGKGYFTTDEMAAAAKIFARVALDLCNRQRRSGRSQIR